MRNEKVSVLITCKNEAHQIAECIASARLLADEIVVADSGSSDGTLEMVRQLGGCRVIEREYVSAGNFKNWAIPQTKHNWVFVLDADERITPELADEIRRTLTNTSYDAYAVRRLNHFLGHPLRFGDWGRDRVTRLFRRHARYQEGTDHSEICLPARQVGQLKQRMPHFTCESYAAYLEKLHRYAQQQADAWHREGRRSSVIHLVGNGPMRFLRAYIGQLGCLDGAAGLQVATLTAYYSFLKQSLLWAKSRPAST